MPDTENWKPPISDELEYSTSKLESVVEPNDIIFGKQLVPLPLHTSHSSYSPTQSSMLSHTESPSSSKHGRSTQPPASKSISCASGLETTTPDKHASKSVTSISRVVRTPEPAGIELFSKEKPKTIDPPIVILNPASSAAPPEPLSKLTPETSNWKPPIGSEVEYRTSKVDSVTVPNSIVSGRQLVPSPKHTPQSS